MRPTLHATYRVQLNKQFTLRDALGIVPYLHELGISHLYCSPILAARPGSMHGYDVADPTRINPELGSVDDLRALAAALHDRGMGILLDIVPNHMGVGPSNPYWEDVLTHGVHSRYARWFDVDWEAGEHKIVLPVLGDELEAVVGRDELALDVSDRTPRLEYFDNTWPVDPATLPAELQLAKLDPTAVADPNVFLRGHDGHARLRTLLDAQHYRLTSWRKAPDEINYRRFFDVNELAALRQEDPAVFAETHEYVLSLVGEGLIDGLRVDHVDGLLDPLAYLERLRGEVEQRAGAGFPIVVEKILSPGERLRSAWPVQGTTGYEFLNDLEDVFLDPTGYAAIERGYRAARRLTSGTFEDVAHAGKVKILEGALRADVGRVVRELRAALGEDAAVPEGGYAPGIVQFIAAMPVYRTYVDGRRAEADADDVAVVDRTVERARARLGDKAPMQLVSTIGEIVKSRSLAALGTTAGKCGARGAGANASAFATPDETDRWSGAAAPSVVPRSEATRDLLLPFVERLQQTSGPATAKGVEDTALYIYVPLASRNEVGGAPDRPLDAAVGRLHEANADRGCHWPLALTCTNTHDTKRSADVRARLDVLSECAGEWQRCFGRWRKLNQRHRATVKGRLAPDTNTEYLLYQTLIGIWPSPRAGRRADGVPDRAWLESARERLEQYMLKAVKEAKTRTSWTDPDEPYENALKAFIAAILTPGDDSPFLPDVARLVSHVGNAGHWNALARVLVHLTSPGTPDTYQGDELWFFALVDPDNRRPVDYAHRAELLASVAGADLSSLEPSDERLKLGLLQRLLHTRRANAALFSRGNYQPLEVRGAHAGHLVAFARQDGDAAAIVVAPRLMVSRLNDAGRPLDWEDTEIVIPGALSRGGLASALRDKEVPIRGDSGSIAASTVLSDFPLGLWLRS